MLAMLTMPAYSVPAIRVATIPRGHLAIELNVIKSIVIEINN
jgi:hypothetical protein